MLDDKPKSEQAEDADANEPKLTYKEMFDKKNNGVFKFHGKTELSSKTSLFCCMSDQNKFR